MFLGAAAVVAGDRVGGFADVVGRSATVAARRRLPRRRRDGSSRLEMIWTAVAAGARRWSCSRLTVVIARTRSTPCHRGRRSNSHVDGLPLGLALRLTRTPGVERARVTRRDPPGRAASRAARPRHARRRSTSSTRSTCPAFLFKRDAIPGRPTTFDARHRPGRARTPGSAPSSAGSSHSQMPFTIRASSPGRRTRPGSRSRGSRAATP